jgi:hypothetical protein
VNPKINRYNYRRHYDNRDDEQWRYCCLSIPDKIKNNSIYDSNGAGSDNKSPHKKANHMVSFLLFQFDTLLKTVSDFFLA